MEKLIGIYLRENEGGVSAAEQSVIVENWLTGSTGGRKVYRESHTGFLRPSFEAMMDDVQTGKVKTVVASKLDRLDLICGSESDFLPFFRTLSENGVRLVVIDDGLDSESPAGIFFVRLYAYITKAREIVRGERIKIGLQKIRDEGHSIGRPRTVDHEKVRTLRAAGYSLQKIAEELNISRGAVQHCLRDSLV